MANTKGNISLGTSAKCKGYDKFRNYYTSLSATSNENFTSNKLGHRVTTKAEAQSNNGNKFVSVENTCPYKITEKTPSIRCSVVITPNDGMKYKGSNKDNIPQYEGESGATARLVTRIDGNVTSLIKEYGIVQGTSQNKYTPDHPVNHQYHYE